MRDVIFTLMILGVIPVAYKRPFIGLLVFSWLAYMRPQDLCWGFARYQRWSMLIALVMFAGWVINVPGRLFPSDPRNWAMIALAILIGLGLADAQAVQKYEINRYIEFVKVVVIALFTTSIIRHKGHLRMMVWVIALSFGFYGVKVGLSGVLSGGSLVVRQGPGGMLEDNNDFSLALVTALPWILHLSTTENRPVFRKGLRIVVPLTALTVILTHSRGAFLSLVVVIMALTWRSKNRIAAFALMFVIAVFGLMMAPQSFKDRIATIGNYEEDGSAMGRLRAWKVAIDMAKGNPILGVGMNKFQQHYLEYSRLENRDHVRVAHNSYLQIWAECGTPAFALYLFLIFWSFVDIWRTRRRANKLFRSSWIIQYGTMFETSLAGFIVGAIFLNRAHFDLFYHVVAVILAYGRIARAEMDAFERDRPTATTVRRGRRGELRFQPRSGFDRRPAVPSSFQRRPHVGPTF